VASTSYKDKPTLKAGGGQDHATHFLIWYHLLSGTDEDRHIQFGTYIASSTSQRTIICPLGVRVSWHF